MIVGVPTEIKTAENRVGCTPAGAAALISHGHKVLVQKGAGLGSGFTDAEYESVGATILQTAAEVYSSSDMIYKVKEPLKPEYSLFKEGQILFTYLHLAPEPELTKVLIDKKVVAIAYETVQTPDGKLPLLEPMSEVAGRMSVQIGASLLQKANGGRGVLLGGVPGVPPAHVVIIGAGTVGTNAAKIAMGMGADVTIFDTNLHRLRYLDDIFFGKIRTQFSTPHSIAQALQWTDLLVGAVLVPGAKAPRLVSEANVKTMKPGSVIVDVAIDQGGCIETIDRVTTHENPTYVKHGVVHYSVANMPGAVPRTSTLALMNATLPYALSIADKGWLGAVKLDGSLAKGVNVLDGKITCKGVAEAHAATYHPLNDLI